MRTLISRSLALPALIFGLSHSYTAFAGPELVNNGTFGNVITTTQPVTFNQSNSGWTWTSLTLALKNQTIPYGCGQYACYGGTYHIWACSSSSSAGATLSQENGIVTLKAGTRYRVSFNGFRDNSTLSTTDTNRTLAANLVVKVKSSSADYAVKDVTLGAMAFGNFVTGINGANSFEFVTPVDTSPSNQANINQTKLSFSFDGTKNNNKGSICLSNISLQDVSAEQNTNRVVVNTIGYPLQGKKIATWVLPPEITDISNYKWQVRYQNNFPTYTYGVGINFFAVVTDAAGNPVKDGNGKYTLQTDVNGKYKIVGGTGTGGQNNWLTPNNGALATTSIITDADSGDRVVTLDFSDMGLQKSSAMSIPDGKGTPSAYTDSNGVKWQVLSGSDYNGGTGISGSGYTIRILDSNGTVVAASKSFSVLNAPFNELKKDALHSFYHQRSGEVIAPQYGVGDKAENKPRNHGAGHSNETATCFTGKDLHGNDWGNGGDGCVKIAFDPKNVSGGWYDAADHGKYVVNGGIALWTLQNMIERLQKKGTLNTAFPGGGLGLPSTLGSNNAPLSNLSDLMAEARKEMQWMLKMQIPGNTYMNVPVGNQATKQQPDADNAFGPNSKNTGVYQVKVIDIPQVKREPIYRILLGKKILIGYNIVQTIEKFEMPVPSDATGDVPYAGGTLPRLRLKLNLTSQNVGGMVFHAVHDSRWTGIPLDPSTYSTASKAYIDPATNLPKEKEPIQRVLMYPTTAATLNFAAVAAQCSRIWKTVDPKFASDCLTAAKDAWTAATRLATSGNIFRYEYTNTSGTAGTGTDGNWTTADPSGKNSAILQYGFALNPMFSGGGAYGDLRVGDEFLWASKELALADTSSTYSATGLTGDCGLTDLQCFNWISGFDWQNVSPLGYLSSWTNNPTSANTADGNRIIIAATTYAGYATPNTTTSQGYAFSKIRYSATNRNTHYDWGANGGVLNRSLVLLAAYEANLSRIAAANLPYCKPFVNSGGLSGGYVNPAWTTASEQSYCVNAYKALDSAVSSMGYLLGRNTLEKSFISGYGSNSLGSAHHRWFAKPADVNFPSIPPGFIAGGPNTRDLPALRANASRYTTEDMNKWLADHPTLSASDNKDWQIGDISDAGQKYLETEIVTKCTTGLGNADSRWTIPAANVSNVVSYNPQKCYGDDYRSFATNEIAINWQAPLVWVSQFLSEVYQ